MLLELDVLTDGLEIRFRAMFEFAVSGKGLESVFLNTGMLLLLLHHTSE